MSDQFFYLRFKFTPKIGNTVTNEREVVVEVPKDLVQRKGESINESLREAMVSILRKVRLSALSRPRRNGLSVCLMKVRRLGIITGLLS